MSDSIWERGGDHGGAMEFTGSRKPEPPVTGPAAKPAGRPDVVIGVNGDITFGPGPGPRRESALDTTTPNATTPFRPTQSRRQDYITTNPTNGAMQFGNPRNKQPNS